MKLHTRTMMVKGAEVELSQFLLDWAERHELTWCEMARALTEQTQMRLKCPRCRIGPSSSGLSIEI